MIFRRPQIQSFLSLFVTIHPHETFTVFYSTSSFFFVLSAYFVVLPLRDEGAISLGISNLPGLFVGSLILTLIAAPLATLIFSSPNLSKAKALVLIHRFFSASLVLFFILWVLSSPTSSILNLKGVLSMSSSTIKEEIKVEVHHTSRNRSDWEDHGWFYISVRIGFFLWVALLNLVTISSTWARVIDVMDNEDFRGVTRMPLVGKEEVARASEKRRWEGSPYPSRNRGRLTTITREPIQRGRLGGAPSAGARTSAHTTLFRESATSVVRPGIPSIPVPSEGQCVLSARSRATLEEIARKLKVGGSGGQKVEPPRATGRAFQMTTEETKASTDVVSAARAHCEHVGFCY